VSGEKTSAENRDLSRAYFRRNAIHSTDAAREISGAVSGNRQANAASRPHFRPVSVSWPPA
jgi:hypothetical protein